jgi:hypothetical protein
MDSVEVGMVVRHPWLGEVRVLALAPNGTAFVDWPGRLVKSERLKAVPVGELLPASEEEGSE